MSYPSRVCLRIAAVGALVVAGSLPFHVASADIVNIAASNVQEGDNTSDTDQDGEASSGDAVAGQVVGVVSSGDTRVDATNHTEGSRARSGDASGANTSTTSTGLTGPPVGSGCPIPVAADIFQPCDVTNVNARNVQEGDNSITTDQTLAVSSGDAVTGQIVGVVTSGTASVVVANTTIDSSVRTGDGEAFNDAVAEVGLLASRVIVLPVGTAALPIEI